VSGEDQDGDPTGSGGIDLDREVALVYGGSLDGFVTRRDDLAKRLKAAGQAGEATTVKAMRKPRVQAWALDALAVADPSETERLAGAVAALAEAQAGTGDVRQAASQLRVVVGEVAAGATRLAGEAGQKVDATTLVPALLVIAGEPEALAALRAGRLVDIPTASGMGLLAAPPPGAPAPALLAVPDAATPSATPSGGEVELKVDDKAVAAARRRLESAEDAADDARAEAEAADEDTRVAEGDAEAADERLRQAETDVREARARLRDAQKVGRAAAQRRRETERALARARAALDGLLHNPDA
jgi:hypothetical protein